MLLQEEFKSILFKHLEPGITIQAENIKISTV